MSFMTTTAKTLSQDLNKEVPDMYVVVAKHSVLGVPDDSIADTIGCTLDEVRELQSDELYKEIRQILGAKHLESRAQTEGGWDELEALAVKKLVERAPFEKDTDTLLRIATYANKAVRRSPRDTGVLDPANAPRRVAITLTSRIIEKLATPAAGLPAGTNAERITERQLSIRDGSMGNPGFEEIDAFLGVRDSRATPSMKSIETRDATLEDLDEDMRQKGF